MWWEDIGESRAVRRRDPLEGESDENPIMEDHSTRPSEIACNWLNMHDLERALEISVNQNYREWTREAERNRSRRTLKAKAKTGQLHPADAILGTSMSRHLRFASPLQFVMVTKTTIRRL